MSGLIVRGQRHHNALRALAEMENVVYSSAKQGFITSRNRFVPRRTGLKLQLAAGIPSARPEGYHNELLFSEDLY